MGLVETIKGIHHALDENDCSLVKLALTEYQGVLEGNLRACRASSREKDRAFIPTYEREIKNLSRLIMAFEDPETITIKT